MSIAPGRRRCCMLNAILAVMAYKTGIALRSSTKLHPGFTRGALLGFLRAIKACHCRWPVRGLVEFFEGVVLLVQVR
jgi:ABC-type amino acid transport system permease subunit